MIPYGTQVMLLNTLLGQYDLKAQEREDKRGINIVFPGDMVMALMKDGNRYSLRPLNFGNGEILTNLTAKEVKAIILKFLIGMKKELFKDLVNKGGSHGYDS